MTLNEINEVVEFYSSIISNEKIGSRFEGNDIKIIWKFGDLIISKIKPLNLSVFLPKIKKLQESKGIRYDDRLYRAAITFRKYWPNESLYLQATTKLDVWTKLRELYPICDRILEGKSEYNKEDVDKLIHRCKDLTYPKAREIFIAFRRKGDKLLRELGIDEYEFNDMITDIQDKLEMVLEENNLQAEQDLRKIFSSKNFRDFRLLLSALQKEDVYLNKKYNDEIKRMTIKSIPISDLPIAASISKLFASIVKFINNQEARKTIRASIPITFIGNVSTYLRAIESDQNKTEFKKNKEILNKFLGNMSS